MEKNLKVTVRFPEPLQQEMLKAIIGDKYGLRGKSKWVSEAIYSFLSRASFVELVDIGEEIGEISLSVVESFYFKQKLVDKIDEAIVTVRKSNPISEGVRSVIIRSAVMQRFFRSDMVEVTKM